MSDVLRLNEAGQAVIATLLNRFDLQLELVPEQQSIPGSYWHETEAGIIGLKVFARPDTPVHSLLHEACHTICMDGERRAVLHTDAGGEYTEEDAVCYLQILLADFIPNMGRTRMQQDMDTWGYTFRLGSATAWFKHDAQDACQWLISHNLIDSDKQPLFRLRA